MQAIPYLLEFLVLAATVPVLLRFYGNKYPRLQWKRPSMAVAAFGGLVFLVGVGQVLKLKSALYPFIPWNMYGGKLEEKTHSFFAFEWIDTKGLVKPLSPARHIPALGYSRGDVYLRNRLKACAYHPAVPSENSPACREAQASLAPYFAALLQSAADISSRGARIRILRTDIPYPLTSGKTATFLLGTVALP